MLTEAINDVDLYLAMLYNTASRQRLRRTLAALTNRTVRSRGMATRIILKCEVCGQLFDRKPSEAVRARACSFSCRSVIVNRDTKLRIPLAERFWEKVDNTPGQGPNGDCWIWKGTLNKDGYGMINVDGRPTRAHIVSYEMTKGPVEHGLCVCHFCDIRQCIRPSHLWLGTPGENVRDMFAKGRGNSPKGERAHASKLTTEQVTSIIADPRRGSDIARAYGVSPSTICMIKKGLRWKHLTP